MAVLLKDNIPAPTLPKEVVAVPELGGEVIVRGLLLRDRIGLSMGIDDGVPYARASKILAVTVVDANGVPIYTDAQWEEFGAQHYERTLDLIAVASRLIGADREDAKKN